MRVSALFCPSMPTGTNARIVIVRTEGTQADGPGRFYAGQGRQLLDGPRKEDCGLHIPFGFFGLWAIDVQGQQAFRIEPWITMLH